MELQVGVKALLKNSRGEFLLLKRSKTYAGIGGRWDVPGGRITPGKTLMNNLAREIKEETGLTFTGKPKLLGAQDILRVPGRHVVRLTYAIERVKGNIKLSEEHTDFKWVSSQELKNIKGLDAYIKILLRKT